MYILPDCADSPGDVWNVSSAIFNRCLLLYSDINFYPGKVSVVLSRLLHAVLTELQPTPAFFVAGGDVLRQFDVEVHRRSDAPNP